MCPMRVILLALSVFIAALVLYLSHGQAESLVDSADADSCTEEESRPASPQSQQQRAASSSNKGVLSRAWSAASFCGDALSGRMLWTQCSQLSKAYQAARASHLKLE
jgi:hypothetical protein